MDPPTAPLKHTSVTVGGTLNRQYSNRLRTRGQRRAQPAQRRNDSHPDPRYSSSRPPEVVGTLNCDSPFTLFLASFFLRGVQNIPGPRNGYTTPARGFLQVAVQEASMMASARRVDAEAYVRGR